jgi:DNA primase catalytic core
VAAGAKSGRITQQSIDAVLQRADLVDLAGGYTQLHKRGAEHSGRCPFHEERTPSFWVNGTKGVYHCFGCGASGDVITFLQAKQGLDFVEAIELLADRYRVDLEYEDGNKGAGKRQSKRRLYELADAAAAFYEATLHGASSAEHARAYLAERHVSQDTARAFRIGFSPEGDLLGAKAKERGFTRDELVEAGLTGANGRDFFHGRLMVPIIDRANRVIGFGARKLQEEQYGGKYVNSKTGPLFDKSRTVFVAPGITSAAKSAGAVVVVEGYMDVIAMWQAGFRNVCAVMGTSLTDEQVVELKRLAPRALFALDPDPAGQAATVRALAKAQAQELDVRVVLLPDGEDPADVLDSPGGRERMAEMLDSGVSLLHFRTSALLGSGDLSDATERERIYRAAIEMFRTTPDGPVRREQIKRVENVLRFDTAEAEAFHAQVGASSPMRLTRQDSWEPKGRGEREVARRVANTGVHSTAITREKRLLAVAIRLADRPGCPPLADVLPVEDAFTLAVHRRARTVLVDAGADALAPARVREDQELFALVAELSNLAERDRVGAEDDETLRATVEELSRAVQLQDVERRLGALRAQLADEVPGDDVATELRRLRALQRELDPRGGPGRT